jgi:membrane-bound lytic murein transglycosylase B
VTGERARRIRFVVVAVSLALALALAVPLVAAGFAYRADGPATGPHTTSIGDGSVASSSASPSPRAVPTRSVPPRPRAPSTVTVDERWVTDRVGRTGIPVSAMRAYAQAALTQRAAQPSCRLSWSTLAAIGAVETHHGTIDDRTLTADGKALPRIVGLPLSGGTLDAVTDTDGGLLDGDDRWDRAVGPMQFIPSTWSAWAVDADGDGRADPDDVDDAAATAARYLCADGHDLGDRQGWIAAVAAYNHREDYVRAVAEEANRLAAS